jgi:hypothetical protein
VSSIDPVSIPLYKLTATFRDTPSVVRENLSRSLLAYYIGWSFRDIDLIPDRGDAIVRDRVFSWEKSKISHTVGGYCQHCCDK